MWDPCTLTRTHTLTKCITYSEIDLLRVRLMQDAEAPHRAKCERLAQVRASCLAAANSAVRRLTQSPAAELQRTSWSGLRGGMWHALWC